MRKYVEIPLEVMERLVEGKCVEGSLRRDEWTGKVTFRAYQRQPRLRLKDRLIKKLPWGWVKESKERTKLFVSVPMEFGTASTMGIFDEQTREAKNALIEQELELIEFC